MSEVCAYCIGSQYLTTEDPDTGHLKEQPCPCCSGTGIARKFIKRSKVRPEEALDLAEKAVAKYVLKNWSEL